MRCVRVLLDVDDIDDVGQFENLVPAIEMLGSGSRMVITSRNREALTLATRPAVCKDVYEVKMLNCSGSRDLFNWHAFLSETPSECFSDSAAAVADACGGHPLALKLMGCMLSNILDPGEREIGKEAI